MIRLQTFTLFIYHILVYGRIRFSKFLGDNKLISLWEDTYQQLNADDNIHGTLDDECRHLCNLKYVPNSVSKLLKVKQADKKKKWQKKEVTKIIRCRLIIQSLYNYKIWYCNNDIQFTRDIDIFFTMKKTAGFEKISQFALNCRITRVGYVFLKWIYLIIYCLSFLRDILSIVILNLIRYSVRNKSFLFIPFPFTARKTILMLITNIQNRNNIDST